MEQDHNGEVGGLVACAARIDTRTHQHTRTRPHARVCARTNTHKHTQTHVCAHGHAQADAKKLKMYLSSASKMLGAKPFFVYSTPTYADVLARNPRPYPETLNSGLFDTSPA